MIVKVIGLLVAASFAAFQVSQINTKSTTHFQDPAFSESEKVGTKDEEDTVNSNPPDKGSENRVTRGKMVNNVREEEMLGSEIKQRRVSFQGKLLELYGLQEEKQYLAELQALAAEKSALISILRANLASLQANNESLGEEARRSALATKKLEAAKRVIAEMERKVGVDARRVKGRVSVIEGRLRGLRADETSERDARVEGNLKYVGRLEVEVGKAKRRGRELELEKRELAVKLVAAQNQIASLSHVTEDEIMETIENEIHALRHGNEELSREVEKLQKERFQFVEELVYQRWLNACLRFEVQNKDKPQTKTKTLKNNNVPTNSDQTSFSSLSFSTESDRVGSTSTFGSSSTESTSSRKSFNMIKRITRWRSRIDVALAQRGKARRFSMSEVERSSSTMRSNEAAIKHKGDQFGSARSLRVRRVSFSDHLVTKFDNDDERKPDIVNGTISSDQRELENEIHGLKNEFVDGLKEDEMVQHLYAVLGFLLFIVLAYALHSSTRFLKMYLVG